MCGIAGILALRPGLRVEAADLRLMAAQLSHRGPDDEAVYLDPRGRCGLAFRRLAVIDLATGRQPMSNETGRIWTICNGEIYNFRALRQRLVQLGHIFRSHSDAEVLVHLYEQSGFDLLPQLDGMFALALWDETRGALLLARDRFGKKPLVYAERDGRLYFASEAKALLALPGLPRRIDAQSLHRYFIFQYVPAPHSIFQGMRKLPPGSALQIGGASHGHLELPAARRYYTVPRPAEPAHLENRTDYAAALRELDRRLRMAVEKRLVADVPLGAFLSGGLDSSVVTLLLRELGVSPLRTFTIGFAEPEYDERAAARLVARHLGAEHHELEVTPDAAELLDPLALIFDEPFADSSAIPTLVLARWARQHVTVALTGDGGDETFAGYDRYRAAQLAAGLRLIPPAVWRRMADWLEARGAHRPKSNRNRLRRLAAALALPEADSYRSWVQVFEPALLEAGYCDAFRAALDPDEPARWFAELYARGGETPADRAIHTDWHSYLPYDLLTKVDGTSMSCALECRAPLLDVRLVEFALGLPLRWRMGLRAAGGKRILRDWAARRLPQAILRRRKSGFGAPLGHWFRRELSELLRERILSPAALARRVFRPEWLTTLIEEHQSGRRNHEHRLWALLMLEAWGRRWEATTDW